MLPDPHKRMHNQGHNYTVTLTMSADRFDEYSYVTELGVNAWVRDTGPAASCLADWSVCNVERKIQGRVLLLRVEDTTAGPGTTGRPVNLRATHADRVEGPTILAEKFESFQGTGPWNGIVAIDPIGPRTVASSVSDGSARLRRSRAPPSPRDGPVLGRAVALTSENAEHGGTMRGNRAGHRPAAIRKSTTGEVMEETSTDTASTTEGLDERPAVLGAASELTLGFGGPNSEANGDGRSHV